MLALRAEGRLDRLRILDLTNCTFEEGDASNLHTVEDESFDLLVSIFGAMFAPDQSKAAAELLRVCRPGGRIGMANWPPEGLIGGGMFATIAVPESPPFSISSGVSRFSPPFEVVWQ